MEPRRNPSLSGSTALRGGTREREVRWIGGSPQDELGEKPKVGVRSRAGVQWDFIMQWDFIWTWENARAMSVLLEAQRCVGNVVRDRRNRWLRSRFCPPIGERP